MFILTRNYYKPQLYNVIELTKCFTNTTIHCRLEISTLSKVSGLARLSINNFIFHYNAYHYIIKISCINAVINILIVLISY